MGMVKAHRYEVRTHWLGGRRLALESYGKPALRVATPPDFKDGVTGRLEPGGVAPRIAGDVLRADAHRDRRLQGRPQAVEVGQGLSRAEGRQVPPPDRARRGAGGDPEHEEEARELALLAKERCIVGAALATPMEVNVEVHVHEAAVTAA